MDRTLKESGLTTPEYAVLAALAHDPGISRADLARQVFVRPQSMTRVLASMTEAGLVQSTPHPDHGRVLQTRLTERGIAALAAAEVSVGHLVAQMLAGTGRRERTAFLRMLEGCRDRLRSLNGEVPGRQAS